MKNNFADLLVFGSAVIGAFLLAMGNSFGVFLLVPAILYVFLRP